MTDHTPPPNAKPATPRETHNKLEGNSGEPIRSTLSGNTDMAELVEWFVANLAERTDELRQAWESGDLLRVNVIAHQLKGSSAGYGFQSLGLTAAELESATKEHFEANASLEQVRASVERLIDVCSRATT